MQLIPGDHPSIIHENVRTLKAGGYDEHQAIHHAHAHAKMTAKGGHLEEMPHPGLASHAAMAPTHGLTSPGADGPDVTGHLAIEKNAPPHSGSDATDSDIVDPAGKGPMIQPSHKGRLHKALGVPEGQPIPAGKLSEAEHSKNPHMRQMANFAENAKGFNHGGKK